LTVALERDSGEDNATTVGAAAELAPAHEDEAMVGGSGAAGGDSSDAELEDGAPALPAGAALAESPVDDGDDDDAGSEGPEVVLVDDADHGGDIGAAAEEESLFPSATAADSMLASAQSVVAEGTAAKDADRQQVLLARHRSVLLLLTWAARHPISVEAFNDLLRLLRSGAVVLGSLPSTAQTAHRAAMELFLLSSPSLA
jgi:hypothetical protein